MSVSAAECPRGGCPTPVEREPEGKVGEAEESGSRSHARAGLRWLSPCLIPTKTAFTSI